MKKLLWIALAALAMGSTVAGCTIDDTYTSCFDSSDCATDTCYQITTGATSGSMCTYTCSAGGCESNLGFNGECYAIGADPTFLCYQQCTFDSDCYSSSVCLEVIRTDGGSDFICVPD